MLLTVFWVLPALGATQPPMTPAYLDHFDAQKTSAALSNGERLAYIDSGPRDAPPLVLIHGYTDSARDWAPIAPLLTPEFTQRLVLISSTGTAFGSDEPSEPPGGLVPVMALRDPIDPDSGFMRDWWKISIRYNPEFARRQRRDAAVIPAHVWLAIADQSLIGVDLRFMLPRVRAPTLLIWGGRDTLISEAGRDALRTGIARTEVRIFTTLGHDLFWEGPPAVADALIGFLARNK